MSTRSGGPKTDAGKAVTRYNAATHGIYSVTPVLPKVERESEWLAHHARVFADLGPEGYMQEIIAERIALNTWRLRRLVRYERERVRHRQRGLMDNLRAVAVYERRTLGKEPLDSDLDLLDSWAMGALIPTEKELMLLMRYEGRLTRHLRLDMLHLEHMKRQRRDEQRRQQRPPLLTLAEPEPLVPPLRPADEPESLGEPLALRSATDAESQPAPGHAEQDPDSPAFAPEHPDSLGEPNALRQLN